MKKIHFYTKPQNLFALFLQFGKRSTFVLSILVINILFVNTTQAQDEDVLFQAFDWNVQNQPAGQTWYDVVSGARNTINDAGIDLIWMPPPSNSAAPQGYLPRELNNLNSAYGTQNQLVNLIDQYHSLGMKVISDIVINHRVGSNDAITFTNPAWPTFYITADDEGRDFVNGPVEFSINGDFEPGFSLKSDGSSGGFAAARDLDHKNPAVRNEIIKWMNFLKNDIGFDGWRYDFVHGYDPIYNKEYNDATSPYFAVGELLESSRVQTNNFVNWTQQSSSAFDFNTKVSLQNAIRDNNYSYLRDGNGNPSGMIGINPTKSVTFLDNHDTGEAQQCCGSGYVFPGGETNLRRGYAYILTHPGNPMVFWTHFFDAGSGVRNAIKDLIAIRKDIRLFAGSSINIAESRNDLYAAYIDGRNGTIAMKLGPGNWSPNGSGWTLRTSGNGYAVWSQGGNDNTGGGDSEFTVFAYNFKTAYTWAGNQATSGNWPGKTMTSDGGNWYKTTVPGDCTNIIFSNNGSGKTRDLNVCESKPYYFEGNFFAEKPNTDGGNGNNNLTIYVRNRTNIYTWKNNVATSGNWPGKSMTDIGNGWRKADIGTDNCSNLIFSNNGSQQTANLNGCKDAPFYYNNQWNANPPSSFPAGAREALELSSKELLNAGKTLIIPNPFKYSADLFVETSAKGLLEVKITNLLGQTKVIYSKNTSSGSHQINIDNSKIQGDGKLFFCTVSLDGATISTTKMIRN